LFQHNFYIHDAKTDVVYANSAPAHIHSPVHHYPNGYLYPARIHLDSQR
jgi:hypothetical protein